MHTRQTPANSSIAHTGRATAVWCGGVALAGVVLLGLAYSNAFDTAFVFDDEPSILDNASIRRLWPLRDVLVYPAAGGRTHDGRPLLNLSLAITYSAAGLAPWVFRLGNLLIHLAASVLLFDVVRRVFRLLGLVSTEGVGGASRPEAVAAAVAVVWAVHPLHTNVVTYTVQRAESLAALLSLAVIDAAIVALVAGSFAAVAAAAICGLLGAAAKETTAAAPLVVAALDLAWHGLPWQRAEDSGRPGGPRSGLRPWLYAGLAVNWLAAGLVAVFLGGRGGSAGLSSAAVWPYFLSQCRGAWLYFERLCWPATFVLDYGDRPLGSLGELWPFLIATVAAAAVVLGGFCLAPRRWFLPLAAVLLLAPSSSVVPVTTQILAEHRAYLPGGFLLAAVAALASGLVATRRQALIAGVAVSIVAGLFMVRTHSRNRDFATPERLWRRNLADWPANPRPLTSLAAALIRTGSVDEAEAVVTAALAAEPEKFLNWVNAGRVLAAQGDDDAAIAAFSRAADLAPERIEPHVNRAIVRSRAGGFAAALDDLDRAVSLRPDLAKPWLARGLVNLRAGDAERAVSDLTRGLALDPESADGWTNLGTAWLAAGDRQQAATAFSWALAINPGHRQALAGLEAVARPE